jgi:hypothetical protein
MKIRIQNENAAFIQLYCEWKARKRSVAKKLKMFGKNVVSATLQTNAGTVPQVGHHRCLPHPSRLTIRWVTIVAFHIPPNSQAGGAPSLPSISPPTLYQVGHHRCLPHPSRLTIRWVTIVAFHIPPDSLSGGSPSLPSTSLPTHYSLRPYHSTLQSLTH